jgi:hypothetical protein
VGDFVRIIGTETVGRVAEIPADDYWSVLVFGEPDGFWGETDTNKRFRGGLEMWTPARRREFKSGEVRVAGTRFNGRIGYLYEDNGNQEEDKYFYFVMLYGDETDEIFSQAN